MNSFWIVRSLPDWSNSGTIASFHRTEAGAQAKKAQLDRIGVEYRLGGSYEVVEKMLED